MKRVGVLFLVVFVSAFCGCGSSSNSSDSMEGKDSLIQHDMEAVLEEIDASLSKASASMSELSLADTAAREVVGGLCLGRPYAVDCSAIDSAGIMRVVEPEEYRKYEGSDISQQEAVKDIFRKKQPAISSMFETVEHIQAATIGYPVFSDSGEMTEALSMLFQPSVWSRNVIEPVLAGTDYSGMVMQKDGLIVFDSDPAQIGLNLVTDPVYQVYPEVLVMAKRMVQEPEGESYYSYTVNGGSEVVAKRAVWKTVEQYGYEWRVMVYGVVE